MTWEVFTFGGGEYLFEVFNGIAAMTSGDNYLNIIKISGLFGLAWVLIQTAFNLNYKTVLNWLVSFVLIYNVMFLPKTSVLINDQLDVTPYKAVDNVPFALAVFASLSSQIGKNITEEFESVFSLPDDLKYHKNGLLFGSKLVTMSAGIQITDSNFASNITSFMKQCVFYDILLKRYTLDDLKKADDLWNFLTVENTPSQARSFLLKNASGDTILTCKDGVAELNKAWVNQITQSSEIFGQLLFPKTQKRAAKRLLLQYLPVSYDHLLGVSKNASELIKQNMLINALDIAATDFSNTGASTDIYTTVRSGIQTRAAFNASHKQAEEWVPILRIVLEVLFYGAFPLVFLLFLLPIGAQVLKGYLATFIWLQAWGPLYALLNLIMNGYVSYKTKAAAIGYGLSVVTQSGILAVQKNAAEISGYLVWFVPFIAAGLAKGMISVTGLATSMLAVPQSAANAAASEAATGNISLGNASMDNASYGNVSANKINDSAFFDGARIQAINSLGGITTVNPDGRVVYDQMGTISKIPNLQVSSNESVARVFSEMAGISKTEGENLATQASDQKSRTMDQLSQYAASHSINEGHGVRFTENATAGEKESYQRLEKAVEEYTRNYGVDKQTAWNAALTGNISGSVSKGWGGNHTSGAESEGTGKLKGVLEGNITGTGSVGVNKSSTDKDGYGKSENIGNTKQLSHDIDIVLNAIRDKTIEVTDSYGHSLNESITEGLQKAERFEESSRIYFDHAKTLNEQAQLQSSKSVSANVDMTQQLIEVLKHEKKLNGEILGEEGALRLMVNNPEEAARRFLNRNSPNIKNSFNHDKEQLGSNNLQEQYKAKVDSMPKGFGNFDNSITKERFNRAREGKSIDNSSLKEGVNTKIEGHELEIKNIEIDKAEVRKNVEQVLEDGAFITGLKAIGNAINPFASKEKPKSNFDDENK